VKFHDISLSIRSTSICVVLRRVYITVSSTSTLNVSDHSIKLFAVIYEATKSLKWATQGP